MVEISVIMGVYNCKDKECLEKSVNSIINQTFKAWEFIICNDGSTDDTIDFLHKLEKKDSRIKIISYKKNRGLSYALNECIKEAKGRYIARQDDDDESYEDRLQIQYDFLEHHSEYDMVGSVADVYDDNGVWGEFKVDEFVSKKSFLWTCPFLHPTVVVRKETFENCGLYRVAKETRRCEDYDLFMRMYANEIRGYNIQKKLYKYRIENSNKKYRPMKYRVDEFRVRMKGFYNLKLMPLGIIFAFKPIIIGLIPQFLFKYIRKKQY